MHTKSDTPLIADETRDSEDSESWPRPAFANVRKSRRRTYLFQAALVTLCLLLSAVTCYLGYRLGLQQAPRLPTHCGSSFFAPYDPGKTQTDNAR